MGVPFFSEHPVFSKIWGWGRQIWTWGNKIWGWGKEKEKKKKGGKTLKNWERTGGFNNFGTKHRLGVGNLGVGGTIS